MNILLTIAVIFYFRPFETLILVILRLFSPLGPKIQEIGHLEHLKWHISFRRPFVLSLYGVSGVLIAYCAHNCSYFDFRPSETLILVILRICSQLGPKIQEMGHLQHIKWPMVVRRLFLMSIYGVAGVLIVYSAHNCRYSNFRPFGTLFLAILGHICYLNSTRTTF